MFPKNVVVGVPIPTGPRLRASESSDTGNLLSVAQVPESHGEIAASMVRTSNPHRWRRYWYRVSAVAKTGSSERNSEHCAEQQRNIAGAQVFTGLRGMRQITEARRPWCVVWSGFPKSMPSGSTQVIMLNQNPERDGGSSQSCRAQVRGL